MNETLQRTEQVITMTEFGRCWMQAVPSFEAFGQLLQAANPFAFWAQAAKLVWFPWLGAASTLTLPRASTPPMLSPGHTESGTQERSRSTMKLQGPRPMTPA
jgi:hypothetical protein